MMTQRPTAKHAIFGVLITIGLCLTTQALSQTKGPPQKNVHGQDLAVCSTEPLTGYYRNGHCNTGPNDRGKHVVCATMTDRFLKYTKSKGNDLSTHKPRYRFPGPQSRRPMVFVCGPLA